MAKNFLRMTTLLSATAVALGAFATSVAAQAQGNTGYLQDTRGAVVKDPFNLCWRTGYWSPAMATAECDPELVPKPKPKPFAPPPPKPVTPKPKPAPEPAFVPPPPKPAPKPAAAPVTQKVTLSADSLFDFDKAVVRPDGRSALDNLVDKLRGVNLEVVIAIGHADRIGSAQYNQKLSVRRAEAVKAYLVSKGIAANRIYTEGKGEKQPVKTCPRLPWKKLVECLQPNRRVEVEVVGTRRR